jgi:hypothetical protein
MSDDAREQQRHGGDQPVGPERSAEEYESPTVDDVPVDKPAVTEPGILVAAGSRDGSG